MREREQDRDADCREEREEEEMLERATERRDREEPELEPLHARRRRRVLHAEAAGRIVREKRMAAEARDVPCRCRPAAKTETRHDVVDVRHRTVGLTPEEVEEHRERRSADDRENLHEPMRREILRDGPGEVRTIGNGFADDLDENRINPPQVFDVVDDEPMPHEPVEPVDDAAVRDPKHPREIVHAKREEARSLPQRLHDEEEERLVPAHPIHDDEECPEVGADHREALCWLGVRREEAQTGTVLEGMVRSLHGGWV